jgi:hypothetical protein
MQRKAHGHHSVVFAIGLRQPLHQWQKPRQRPCLQGFGVLTKQSENAVYQGIVLTDLQRARKRGNVA